MKYLKLKFLLIFAALAMAIPPAWAETTVEFDFTTNEWGIPTGSTSNPTQGENQYTYNGYTITLYSLSGSGYDNHGYYYNNSSHYLMMMRNSARLILPAFDKVVNKIEVICTDATSTNAWQNIFLGNTNTSVSTETKSAGTHEYVINANYQDVGTVYSLKQTANYNAQVQKVIVYLQEEVVTTPTITALPKSLNINQDGDSFTVTGRNLIDNIGVNPSTGFSTDCDPKPNGWETWGFANNGGSVDGTVTVNYVGRPLNATGTVTMGTKPYSGAPDSEDITEVVDVNFQYDGDIYVLGNFGDQGWNFNDASHKMTPNNGIYTTRFTVPANSWLIFSKKLSDNGLWNESYFGAPDGNDNGNWEVRTDRLGIDYSIPSNSNYCLYVSTEGEYIFTVDATTNKFKIEKVEPIGKTCPAVIEFESASEDSNDAFDDDLETFLQSVTAGANYIQSISSTRAYAGKNGIKISSSRYNGTLTINLKPLNGNGSWRTTKVIVNAIPYSSSDVASFELNDISSGDLSADFADYEFNLDGSEIQSITIDAVKRIYVKSITIMHECGDEPIVEQVAIPTFDPAGGTYTEVQNVEISCATDGATIYYTTDGTEPTTASAVYDEPIAVAANMTIKAMAVKEGMDNSTVATAEYIINLPTEVETIAAAQALENNEKFNFTGNAVVTFHNGNHLYIRDGSGSGLIYGVNAVDKKYENGDVLTPGWKATYELYQVYTPEFTSPSGVASTENNNGVDPIALTTIELSDVNKYAKIDNVTITDNNGNNYYYTVNDTQYCLRRAYTDLVGELTVGKRYNVTGVVTIFRSGSSPDYTYTPQLNLISATLIKEDPTLSFGETTAFTVYPNAEFTPPTLTTTPAGLEVTYTSSDEDVAAFVDGELVIGDKIGSTTITATFAGNDEYNEATATYTITVEPKPFLVADNTVEFNDVVVGETATKTFDVAGENLKGDVTLTLTDENGVFAISTTTIAKADAEAEGGATVTVTYTPTEEAIDEATITIKSTDAEDVTVTLTGMATLPAPIVISAITFTPEPGSYTEPVNVTIGCDTEGAVITYSTDGGETWLPNGSKATQAVTVDKDMTLMAKATVGDKVEEATAVYSFEFPVTIPTIEPLEGYYFVKNNGNNKYANVQGRKTLTFTDAPADKAGTVIYVKTDANGQVQSLRSQAADLQGYADKAMNYVPELVHLVADKLEVEGVGALFGDSGVDAILDKFNEAFDHHLYVEEADGGYRIYGKTPSMQPVVEFYRENQAKVDAKLPLLETAINNAIDKILEKTNGSGAAILTPFSLHQIWENMNDPYLIEPTDDASTLAFYHQVLMNKDFVWSFAYETAMIYWTNLKEHPKYETMIKPQLGEYADYIEKIEQVRPNFKYYIAQKDGKPDFISQGNVDVNTARNIWSVEPRTDFTVNVPEANEVKDGYVTTLYTDFGYTLPEGVTAYAVTAVDENGYATTETIGNAVPAQTPVLLKATTAGDKVLTLNPASRDAIGENLLVGPDYLIGEYQIKNPTVENMFNMVKTLFGEEIYNRYMLDYEHLMLRYAGLVNNKYFWGLPEEEVAACGTTNEYNQVQCVVRSLDVEDGVVGFYNNGIVSTNKAFLVSTDFNPVMLDLPEVPAPTFTPEPGSYTEPVTVTINCENGDAEIYYSTDGGNTWIEGNTVELSEDMTLMAKAVVGGVETPATAVYSFEFPVTIQTIEPLEGYYFVKNNGNNKYANVQGRKTLTFTDAPADKAGTVIYVKTDANGQVQSLRSQAADLQGYADKAMNYVPELVHLVAEKLEVEGVGALFGDSGVDAILDKFNEAFDHHLYVEEADGGYRIYGKTPSMQPVVEFYRENQAKVDAKLPLLEDAINDAIDKILEKTNGSGAAILTPFSLHQIWENMNDSYLIEPADDASTLAFYHQVLMNKDFVWSFAYETAMIYWTNLKEHPKYETMIKPQLGEFAEYIEKIEQVRPNFKYYIAQKDGKPDFISEGNVDVNADRNIWTVEKRTDFTVNIAGEMFGCPYADGIGGYATTNYTDFAYTLPAEVTAYKVTAVDEDGEATLKALEGTIPAQTPVMLIAKEAGDYTLTVSTEAGTADLSGNLLVGPDYLIGEYQIKNPTVENMFNMVKTLFGEEIYNRYMLDYEHLMLRYAGLVNNKYFWGLPEEEVAACGTTNEFNQVQCVVRSLDVEDGVVGFYNNGIVSTNKAFLVNTEFDPITLNNLRGDVNHDGSVNIKDVTDLIERLLDNPDPSCPYCSDFNMDHAVNIWDVTSLIDYLLGKGIDTTVPNEGEGE